MMKKRIVSYAALLLTLAILAVSVFPFSAFSVKTEALSTKEKIDNFLKVICPLAAEDMRKSDILASLTIAQAILESGWGTSDLAIIGKNLFGIKAFATWKGKAYSTSTKKVYSSYAEAKKVGGTIYRAYNSWEESVENHSYLFNNSSIYAKLRGLKDYKVASRFIVESGYAGDNKKNYGYSDKLIYLIEHYNLTQYDTYSGGKSSSGSSTSTTSTTKTTTTTTTTKTTSTATASTTSVTLPSSVTLNGTELVMGKGTEYTLMATVSPSKADQKVTWSSSSSCVSVNNGKVSAKSEGTATITAKTSNGKKATCKVTVKNSYVFVIAGDTLDYCGGDDETVELPYGIKSIAAYAFKDCASKTIIIPETATDISSRAFCGKKFIIKAKKGSTAEKYAKNSGMTFKSLFGKEWIIQKSPISILTGMPEDTSIGTLLSYFSGKSNVDLLDSRGKSIKQNTTWHLCSGYSAVIGENKYKIVVKGDTDGDGEVSEKDCERIAGYLKGKVELGGAGLSAADINFDGKVTCVDYLKARAYINRGYNIYA